MSNINKEASAAQLRRARQYRGLTSAQLAELAGVAQNTVLRAERGDPVRPTSLVAIRAALDMPTPSSDDVDMAVDIVRLWLRRKSGGERVKASQDIVRWVMEQDS